MTTLQLTIAVLQSIMQLWAAAAYGAAFFRTRLNPYRTLAVGQLLLLGSVLAMLRFGMIWLAALLTAATLWAMFAILANRSSPLAYPGYASSRDVFTFRAPLPGDGGRRDGLFVPHAARGPSGWLDPEQKRLLALCLVAIIITAIMVALVRA